VDPTDQADLEALADQRRINQLEHQADLKALVVPEDPADPEDMEDPEDLEDPEAQVSICC
jgi:hypothetical protein